MVYDDPSYRYKDKAKRPKVRALKVGFLQKVMAKVSNLSNRHACEPKIVPEHLFPVSVINKLQVILWIHLAKRSACYEF